MTHPDSNHPPESIPCVIYAARSAPGGEEERSVRSQTDEVRERIAAEDGRTIIGEFAEHGVSGFHGERGPELDAAMAAAVAGAEEHGEAELWVFHSSRLARGSGRKGKRSLAKIHADLLYEDVQVRSVSDDEFVRNPMLVGIASSQNYKYGRDHGAHVARGKRDAHKAGKWTGGPAPDGYLAKRRLKDDGGKEAWLELDPQRAPVIRAAFDLAEQDLGDATVARKLNAAGHRTKAGKPWTRRRVQSMLANPVYAGRVVRWGEGSMKGRTYRRFDEPLEQDGQHPRLVEPLRFDRIRAARKARDRAAEGRAKAMTQRDKGLRGGRPTVRYALSRIAVCDRCGEHMHAMTSPYKRKRKGGTQARRYVCPSIRIKVGDEPACDQPPLAAEAIDRAVVAYLDGLFIDYEAFVAQLSRGADQKRGLLASALDGALGELDRLDATAGKVEADYVRQIEAGNEAAGDVAARALERIGRQRREAERRVEECRRRLDGLDEQPHDTALDAFNALKRAIAGGDGNGLGELNARLRAEFEEFRLDRMDDGTVGVLPVLRERPAAELFGGYAAWAEVGKPLPTEDEARRIQRSEDALAEGMWVTGGERIRPPAKALSVVDRNPTYPHG